jgi:hypothetical protein
MADFSSVSLGYNTGTDALPTWTGTALALSGSSGANELRMALSGTGASTSTASASWPYMNRPASGTSTVNQLWAFTADTTGNQITTYTGDNTKANVLRWVFSADGNPVSAMQLTYYADNTHTNPSAGTQPPGSHNDAFTNGHATDTSSTSYIKINAYGSGLTAGGSQETPSAGSVGTNPSATTGSAGSATTSAGSWLSTWQSAQGTTQYITGAAIPKASTAFNWYCTKVIFLGANISTGTYTIVFDLSYSYS